MVLEMAKTCKNPEITNKTKLYLLMQFVDQQNVLCFLQGTEFLQEFLASIEGIN